MLKSDLLNFEAYLEEIPKILALHTETADLALQMKQMNLPDQLHHRFTLAISGQMKAGKSTLLNAIIEDDKAPVGINECTATINRFLFSKEKDLWDKFRVYWKAGFTEDHPLENINAWLGYGTNIEKTTRLDFYCLLYTSDAADE